MLNFRGCLGCSDRGSYSLPWEFGLSGNKRGSKQRLGEVGSWASGKGLMGTRISVFPFLLLKGGTWFWHFLSNIFPWILCSALLLSYQKSSFSAGAYSSQEGFPSLRLPPSKKALIEIVFKIDGDTGGTLTLFHPTCIFGGKLTVKCFFNISSMEPPYLWRPILLWAPCFAESSFRII